MTDMVKVPVLFPDGKRDVPAFYEKTNQCSEVGFGEVILSGLTPRPMKGWDFHIDTWTDDGFDVIGWKATPKEV